METDTSQKKHPAKLFYTILFIFEILFLLAIGLGFYSYVSPNNPVQRWYERIINPPFDLKQVPVRVGKLMILPQDEDPTLAMVSDKTKLQGQPFFSLAENGDVALIYVKAKKAILYRPSVNKVIEVSSVNIMPKNEEAASVLPDASASAAFLESSESSPSAVSP